MINIVSILLRSPIILIILLSCVSSSPVPGAIPGGNHPLYCGPGTLANKAASACQPCSPGTAQPGYSSLPSCPACSLTSYAPAPGLKNCLNCKIYASNANGCDPITGKTNHCILGYGFNSGGLFYSLCQFCGSGVWSNGATGCLPCPSICGGSCSSSTSTCTPPSRKIAAL